MSKGLGQGVTANYRYRGAWNEVNIRISEKQRLLQIYVYLISPTLFASFIEIGDRPYWRVVYLVPFVSLLFALLLRAHEQIIDNLTDFLSKLEKIDNANGASPPLPSYHAVVEQEHEDPDLKLRRHRYVNVIVGVGLLAVTNLLGLVFSLIHYEDFSRLDVRVTVLLVVVSLCSIRIAMEPWLKSRSHG